VCERTHDLAAKAQALEALGTAQYECGDLLDAVVAWRQAMELYDHTGNAATAARLLDRIEAVPIFHQEIVPLGRSADQAREPSWPREDEVTRPIGSRPVDESDSTW
jgi:hypothetical protein